MSDIKRVAQPVKFMLTSQDKSGGYVSDVTLERASVDDMARLSVLRVESDGRLIEAALLAPTDPAPTRI